MPRGTEDRVDPAQRLALFDLEAGSRQRARWILVAADIEIRRRPDRRRDRRATRSIAASSGTPSSVTA